MSKRKPPSKATDDPKLRFELLYPKLAANCPGVTVTMDPRDAITLLALIRFSLRHPGIGPVPTMCAMQFIGAIESLIAKTCPEMIEIVRQMDDWRQDVPVRPDLVLPAGCKDKVVRHAIMDKLGHTTAKVCETARDGTWVRRECTCGQVMIWDTDAAEAAGGETPYAPHKLTKGDDARGETESKD